MKAKSKANREAKDQIPMGEKTKGIPSLPPHLLVMPHSPSVYSRGIIGDIPKVQKKRVQLSTCLSPRRHPMVKHVHEDVVMAGINEVGHFMQYHVVQAVHRFFCE